MANRNQITQSHRGNQGLARVHPVAQGLFILRYVSSNAPGASPTVEVAPQNSADVEVLHWPNLRSPLLRGPGDGLVIRALRDTAVALKVAPAHPGGSIDAQLQLEPVSRVAHKGFVRVTPDAVAGGPPRAISHSDEGVSLNDIEILAHVARRGDLVSPMGEWICGPDFPMAIEGLEIRWPTKPRGLEIVTRVSSSRGSRDLPHSLTGEFVGSRGRAAPVTELEMSLVGARGADFALRVDALFQGSAVQSAAGRVISLRGPTSREPLLGLRLSVVPSSEADQVLEVARPMGRQVKAVSSWRSAGRVRVFRGSKKSTSQSVGRNERV